VAPNNANEGVAIFQEQGLDNAEPGNVTELLVSHSQPLTNDETGSGCKADSETLQQEQEPVLRSI
jgi:hypothetical protein